MFGQFLEITVATRDIATSVQFYERLQFRQLLAGDIWSHPYGVLSDGRLYLGLHQRPIPTPMITFVRPELRQHLKALRDAGVEPVHASLGECDFHELRLHDPSGNVVTLLEARTYSAAVAGAPSTADAGSLCGYFLHLSLPAADFTPTRDFWERAGLIALGEIEEPYPHLPLTSDRLELALHQRRILDTPMLVFETPDLMRCLAELQKLDVEPVDLPRGLDRDRAAMLEAPEGTALLLLQAV
jgi:catechol 2,3-dioxygenase-like lactoylglutathione lyase family enzyme